MKTVPSLSLVKGYNYFDSTKIGSIFIEKNYLPILLSGTNQILSIPIDFSAEINYCDYTFLSFDQASKSLSSVKTAYTKRARYYVRIKYAAYSDRNTFKYIYSTPGQYYLNVYINNRYPSVHALINVLGQFNKTSVETTISSSTTPMSFLTSWSEDYSSITWTTKGSIQSSSETLDSTNNKTKVEYLGKVLFLF